MSQTVKRIPKEVREQIERAKETLYERNYRMHMTRGCFEALYNTAYNDGIDVREKLAYEYPEFALIGTGESK